MTLTLEEAIKHATETAERQDAAGCRECAADHRQLADWLIELKWRREKMNSPEEPEHTMEEFMYGQDLGSLEDGSL